MVDATVYQRWSHKTNYSNCWRGKRPSSRNSRRRKKRSRRPNTASATTLTRQIRRAQARVSTADRKRRTRRLILIGSYVDSVSQADPEAMTRLRKGLDEFLERDQDRALFDLAAPAHRRLICSLNRKTTGYVLKRGYPVRAP